MLRILLELLVSNYLDHTGKMQPLLQTTHAKEKGLDWTPTLRRMLTQVLTDNDLGLSRSARKALQKMITDDKYPLSLDKMDQFIHNRYVVPSENDLRSIWSSIEETIEKLLDPRFHVPPETKK
jgi:hypothetical protein